MTEKATNLGEKYVEVVKKSIEAAQSSGDIPRDFVYGFGGKTWVMTLPRSVMAQKRMLNVRAQHFDDPNNFAAEEELLKLIAANTRVDNQPVNLDSLEYGELEVMKLAYMDGLLLPLFLGGDKAVTTYMETATGLKK